MARPSKILQDAQDQTEADIVERWKVAATLEEREDLHAELRGLRRLKLKVNEYVRSERQQ